MSETQAQPTREQRRQALLQFLRTIQKAGLPVEAFPLSFYRKASFYTMRTDALDRFGTRLEQRFTAREIEALMREAGLERIRFSDQAPFWCGVGFRSR